MRKEGYRFIERDISRDPAARQEMMQRQMTGVPSFVIGNEQQVGFSPEWIKAHVKIKIEACPHCGQKIRIPKGKGKIRVRCSACQNQFVIKT
ncbi:hypothetical protein SANA_20700 [Gottschalkiaceae bacterium SANA]|nr:hypothetical protein SANA_20700 [Gottschalkiaceae bacterium SANA]